MKGIGDYGRLDLQMGVGSEYRIDDFRRAVGKMSGWTENTTDPPRTCEWCGKVKTDELAIDGRMPRRMCASCWDRYYDRFVGLSRETPNYFLGVLMGLLMSLVTGMVWALSLIIVENIERNFFEPQYLIYYVIPSSIFMGTYMARRVMWGLKRKDVRAYIISGAFSVLSGVNGILAASLWRTYFDFKIQDKWRYLYGFQRYGLERFFLTYGEVLATGVFICATMLFALTETRELLLSYRLVRVRAPEKRAAKWEYIEDRSVRIR